MTAPANPQFAEVPTLMDRCRILLMIALAWLLAALAIYEVTAKSPRLTGFPLPGWWAAERAERATRWQPPTGILPFDKLLHEGEEAVRFYATLIGGRSVRGGYSR